MGINQIKKQAKELIKEQNEGFKANEEEQINLATDNIILFVQELSED